jgi:ABC-2 type transport system ATP-binding protein
MRVKRASRAGPRPAAKRKARCLNTPLLELRDIRKRFGATPALAGVSLAIRRGEIFGLLGPNGAGKTTLLSIVSGLLDHDSGAIDLDGKPFQRRDREARRLLGLVPQELAVYQELSGRENLRFFGELYGLSGHTLRRQCDDILSAIGLTDQADQRAGAYSGGMKRRLNLGVALVHSPRLLLLDEPTAGVDAQSRNHIFEEVRRLNRTGVTVVYTTHYMEEVQTLCRRVAILDHGRIVACDELPNLLRLLPGRVRFRLKGDASPLPQDWCDVTHRQEEGEHILESDDVKALLIRLVGWVKENGAELESLHVEEANLERVFLHLTGRGLRD